MDFARFREMMRRDFRLDLNSYKEAQLKRRIDSFLARRRIPDYGTLFQQMQSDRALYEVFLDHLTINVSEFFRDPEKFRELQTHILPALLQRKRTLNIWSAACAAGAEPYSVAIILEELTPGRYHRVEATDIDKNILAKAKEGNYPANAVRNVSPRRLASFFTQENSLYVVKEEIRRRVSFRRHDLLTGPFGQGYDLILCRNVTIYFTREAQDRLNQKFVQALTPGGILFLGGSEMIFNYNQLGLEKISSCFYYKVSAKEGG